MELGALWTRQVELLLSLAFGFVIIESIRGVYGLVRSVLERFFAPHLAIRCGFTLCLTAPYFWKVKIGLHKVQLILVAWCGSFSYMGWTLMWLSAKEKRKRVGGSLKI